MIPISRSSSTRCLFRRSYATIQPSSQVEVAGGTGGAITIDPTLYGPRRTVKPPGSKKSLTHADYVHFYRANPTMLILQHNNLKQSQLLKIRGELGTFGAKLRIVRVGIFEHAVKVATLQDSCSSAPGTTLTSAASSQFDGQERGVGGGRAGKDYASMDVNDKELSVAAKNVRRRDETLDVTQLLSGPICTITFPDIAASTTSSSQSGLAGAQRGAADGSTGDVTGGLGTPGTPSVSPDLLKKVLQCVTGTQNKLILLGGRFEGQVFAIDALERVATLPGLETLRGQLISVLGSPAVRLSQLLGAPAQTLSRTVEGRKVALEGETPSAPAQ